MMTPLPPVNINKHSWQFLERPKKLVDTFAAEHPHERPLKPAPTRRQAKTARHILRCLQAQRGILLADDVGTGKTTIAAWVACVFLGADVNATVRVLAPNRSMQRRWREEIEQQVKTLRRAARHLKGLQGGWKKRLRIKTHHSGRTRADLSPSLLIVDEAHRAKGKDTEFVKRLKTMKAARVLFVTATPFSISIGELERMLRLVGAPAEATRATKRLAELLGRLYSIPAPTNPEEFAGKLVKQFKEAIQTVKPFIVRTHPLGGLEERQYGQKHVWPIEVPAASEEQLRLLALMDRLLKVGRRVKVSDRLQTNDARFHVGWAHLDDELKRVKERSRGQQRLPASRKSSDRHVDRRVVVALAGRARQILRRESIHPKIEAIATAVRRKVQSNEKVLLFCHHHATAAEVTTAMAKSLRPVPPRRVPPRHVWKGAWLRVIDRPQDCETASVTRRCFDRYIEWLCCPALITQVAGWLSRPRGEPEGLAEQLRMRPPRVSHNHASTIAREANALLHRILQSRSSRRVFSSSLSDLPCGSRLTAVIGICEPPDGCPSHLFFRHEPDTLLMIFNSPFGPDVLVTTDRLSEGMDMHGYCRHLIHYELDPSPLRAIQRNGRVRRINSWAARTRQRIEIAYPSFTGTRDERLVRIVQSRVDAFDLMLGGVNWPVGTDIRDPDVMAQRDVVNLVKKELPVNPFAPRS